jgi:hypothetical protein
MNKMSKSEVYSWRLSPKLKAELERAAREENVPLSGLLERISREWLTGRKAADDADQAHRRAALMACAGIIKGDGTSATNANVRKVIGDYLEAKHGGRRTG